jgi:hypothetical protein
MRRHQKKSFVAKVTKEGHRSMLSDAFWYDVAERIIGSFQLPAWETVAILLKDLIDLENTAIVDEWCDDALDDVLTKIVEEAALLKVDREALEERLAPLRASLRLSLRAMLDRSKMATRSWRRLLPQYGAVPVGKLPLRIFFTPGGAGGQDLSHWVDTVTDAAMVRGARYVWLKLMFGGGLPIPVAMASWGLDRLRWDAKDLYGAVGRLRLGDVWERQRRVIAADVDLPESLVRPILDAVSGWMTWRLGDVTPPYPWAGFYHDLSYLLARRIDPRRKLSETERQARFVEVERQSRAESADMYRDLIDRRLGDLRFADHLLVSSGAEPALQVLCWNLVARLVLSRRLG